MTDRTNELAGLPEDVREALAWFEHRRHFGLHGNKHFAEITGYCARLRKMVRERSQEMLRMVHESGELKARAERAEAELAALKRSPQGTVQAVRPQADGCYLVEVRCDSAGVASLFAQRVALLPVGGETK